MSAVNQARNDLRSRAHSTSRPIWHVFLQPSRYSRCWTSYVVKRLPSPPTVPGRVGRPPVISKPLSRPFMKLWRSQRSSANVHSSWRSGALHYRKHDKACRIRDCSLWKRHEDVSRCTGSLPACAEMAVSPIGRSAIHSIPDRHAKASTSPFQGNASSTVRSSLSSWSRARMFPLWRLPCRRRNGAPRQIRGHRTMTRSSFHSISERPPAVIGPFDPCRRTEMLGPHRT